MGGLGASGLEGSAVWAEVCAMSSWSTPGRNNEALARDFTKPRREYGFWIIAMVRHSVKPKESLREA